jgi:hypothetical protein
LAALIPDLARDRVAVNDFCRHGRASMNVIFMALCLRRCVYGVVFMAIKVTLQRNVALPQIGIAFELSATLIHSTTKARAE